MNSQTERFQFAGPGRRASRCCATTPAGRAARHWPSSRIRIRCSAAPWTTRWCRRWRAPSCSAAGPRCASTSAASAPAKARTTKAAAKPQDLLAVVDAGGAAGAAGAGRLFVRRLRHGAARCRRSGRQREIERIVLVGTAASRFPVPPLPPEAHERTLVDPWRAGRHGAAVRRAGLGAAAVTSRYGRSRGRAFLSRTIAASEKPGGAPPPS